MTLILAVACGVGLFLVMALLRMLFSNFVAADAGDFLCDCFYLVYLCTKELFECRI